jgi:hypothetical protein
MQLPAGQGPPLEFSRNAPLVHFIEDGSVATATLAMTNSTAEYRESLAAAGAPGRAPPQRAVLVVLLAADLQPALEAAGPQPQRAARPEQDSVPA